MNTFTLMTIHWRIAKRCLKIMGCSKEMEQRHWILANATAEWQILLHPLLDCLLADKQKLGKNYWFPCKKAPENFRLNMRISMDLFFHYIRQHIYKALLSPLKCRCNSAMPVLTIFWDCSTQSLEPRRYLNTSWTNLPTIYQRPILGQFLATINFSCSVCILDGSRLVHQSRHVVIYW